MAPAAKTFTIIQHYLSPFARACKVNIQPAAFHEAAA